MTNSIKLGKTLLVVMTTVALCVATAVDAKPGKKKKKKNNPGKPFKQLSKQIKQVRKLVLANRKLVLANRRLVLALTDETLALTSQLTVELSVDTELCVADLVICPDTDVANTANANPIAVTMLVTRNGEPVDDLVSDEFSLILPFTPDSNLDVDPIGPVDNAGNGLYQLVVEPSGDWAAGAYSGSMRVEEQNVGEGSALLQFTISDPVLLP